MKKVTYSVLVLMLTFLAACSSNNGEAKKESNSGSATNESGESAEQKSDEGEVNVDKGLLSVEITIPASMVEDEDIDETIASAKEQGVKEVTKNDDGSLTYKMSKSVHKDMMKEMGKGIEETVKETENSEDYKSIKEITYNDSFSEFTMVVDKDGYENSMDGFAALTLGMSGMFYQVYDGADKDDYKVTITLKDEASGEVFDKIVYPDAMEEK